MSSLMTLRWNRLVLQNTASVARQLLSR